MNRKAYSSPLKKILNTFGCGTLIASAILPLGVLAQTVSNADSSDVASFTDMFSKGEFSGDFRTIYFSSHNAFYTPGRTQNTVSYGGKLGFTSARMDGFSFGVSAFMQRGIGHSDDPNAVDGYLGPNLTAMGEAYVKWQHDKFQVTVGNQELDIPWASTYDWRMAEQLFQGVSTRYGDADNYVTAWKMTRFKSYIDNTFRQNTTYNSNVDSFSDIGMSTTNGFWGVGGNHKSDVGPVTVDIQGWYSDYLDYAKMIYVEANIEKKEGEFKPFLGVQAVRETGDGRQLLGNVDSKVLGLQLGVKHNSLKLAFGYDRIVPNADSYLNGVLVTPYAHNVSSGPLFAQPFLTSTQDLGAGNAYAIDLSGAPANGWFVGGRYSFMDLKSNPTSPSLNQSEYLVYAIHNFDGKLKGWSVADFLALQSSPTKSARFLQNRLTLEYKF